MYPAQNLNMSCPRDQTKPGKELYSDPDTWWVKSDIRIRTLWDMYVQYSIRLKVGLIFYIEPAIICIS